MLHEYMLHAASNDGYGPAACSTVGRYSSVAIVAVVGKQRTLFQS